MNHQGHENVAFEADKGEGEGNIPESNNSTIYQQNWERLEKHPNDVEKYGEHRDTWVGDNGSQTVDNGSPPEGASEKVPPERVVDQKRAAEEFKKPLWFCKVIVSYPKTMFGLTLGLHILMFLITGMLVYRGYDIIPITFDRVPLDIRNDVDYLQGLAWLYRYEETLSRVESDATNQTERSQFSESVTLYFEGRNKANVLTKENLLKMKEIENEFFTLSEFKNKFCLLDELENCTKPRSLARYFDGTFKTIDSTFDDPNYSNVLGVLYLASIHNQTKQGFQYYLGKDAVITSSSAFSSITRVSLSIGQPFEGFNNDTDREEEQTAILKKFMNEHFRVIGEKHSSDGARDMDVIYFSPTLLSVVITRLVVTDLSLAFGSLAFIVIFVCLQTGSFWVTGFAILSIITGFCATNLVYRVILDYRYFGTFHVLAIFIILGIGADDVFVYFDTWKATAHKTYPSLAHRVSDNYSKAAKAMFFTSLTTAVAFIVSAASPLLGVSSFGVFAGLLVLVNYMSVVIFFPTVVVTYHLAWEKYKCCCCCPRIPVADYNENSPPGGTQRKHPVVRFFRGPYFALVTHKIARWIILVIFLAVLTTFVYFATQLQINEEQIKFLKDDSNFGKALDRRNTGFKAASSERATQLYIVWGLKQQDLSKCHHTDTKCYGDTVFDNKFDMNPESAQQAFMDLCKTLKTLPDAELEKLHIRKNIITNQPEIDCFTDALQQFLTEEQDRLNPMMNFSRKYPVGTQFTLPLSKSEVTLIMNAHPIYNTSNLHPQFDRYFEVAVSYWLYNGFLPTKNTQFYEYNYIIGEAQDEDFTVKKELTLPGGETMTYSYGTVLKYAAIIVNTTIESATLGYPTGLPIRQSWQEFLQPKIDDMPPELAGGFNTVPSPFILWHWLKVQQQLSTSALYGIVIGISLAFPVLVIATMNIVTGALATLTIICITASVVGVIPLAGWKLGVLESLNLVLIVGLAVDYVVHLAEGYSRSPHRDRLGRLRDTLEEVGISVLSGSVTTLGASVFLLAAQIIFFVQFGLFMFCTIGFSIAYSLGLFITVLGLIGPQNDFGSLKPLFAKCFPCCKK